jgi:hypothetical protein
MPKTTDWHRRIDDFDGYRTGQVVEVRRGAGWSRGTIIRRGADHVCVDLKTERRVWTVWDSRCLR